MWIYCGFYTIIWIVSLPTLLARKSDSESIGRENEDLIANLAEDDYELVYPTQIRDKIRVGIDTRNHYFRNATLHHVTATFVVKTLADRVRIHLKLNRLLLPERGVTKWFNFTESVTAENERLENCYYQGEVHGDPQSFVALSTCAGLDGIVFWQNSSFVIKPLRGVAKNVYLSRNHPHIWYRQPEGSDKGVCGTSGVADWDYTGGIRKVTPKRRYRRDAESDMKFLEVAIVADNSLTSEFRSDPKAVLSHVLQAVNVADLIFQSLSIRLSLVYMESWLNLAESRMSITVDAAETLLNLFDYSTNQLYSVQKDLVVFVTRKKFKQQTILMSASGSICSAKAAAVVKDTSFKESFQLGSLISHAVGHVIGMKHDSLNPNSYACGCQWPGGCLLQDPTLRLDGFPHAFSNCNKDEFFAVLNKGNLRCLFNKPMESDPLENCGNKVIDQGEQCDCGSVEECDMIDPCCDPITCKLRSGSECAAGSCCQDCKLKSEGIICRAAVAECDVPEFCSGTSGNCPADGHKMNGIECGHKQGYCYQGSCSSAATQCQAIWGPDARNSPLECYAKFNVRGTETGHCGVHSNGEYIPCNSSDIMCGLLQCRGSREIPVMDQFSGSYYKIEFPVDGTIAQCRVAFDTKKTDLGVAKEGTKCGRNMICVDRHCVPISTVTPDPQCPTNNLALQCSGHGVCTNLNFCFCEQEWTGADCSYRVAPSTHNLFVTVKPTSNVSSVLTKTWSNDPPHLDLQMMLIILGGVSGGVVVVVLFVILCYRRRTTSALEKKQKLLGTVAFTKDYECNSQRSESSADTAHRSIKFGHMPSYRNEKNKGGKKSRQRNGSRTHKMKEIDERSATSEQSMEQQQPLMGVQPQLENTNAQLLMNEMQRQPEKGILKNYPSFSTAPVVRPSYGRCYSDVDGPSSASAVNTPHLAHNGSRRSTRKRSDGYESDTYASHLMFERSLRRLNDYDLCQQQQQIYIDQMETQERFEMEAELDRQQMSYEKDLSARQQSRASGRSRFGNNSNVNSPFMGRGVLSHVNENRLVVAQPADAEEADCSFSRSEDNNCSFSETEVSPTKYSARSINGKVDLSYQNGVKPAKMSCQAETPSDSSSEGKNLLKTRGFPQNGYSQAQREDSAPECLHQQKVGGSPMQDRSPTDRQTKLPDDAGSGESRRLSPTNSVASSGRGSFMGRPQPLKLRNIEYLLKQLDSHSLDLSPASSTEMSAPEADKAFAAVEIGSHTESQQGGHSDMVDSIFSPQVEYRRDDVNLHQYVSPQHQLCNFDDSSGYPPQAYGEEPMDPCYMAEGFVSNYNSPGHPSPFKIESNGRQNGGGQQQANWTKNDLPNMKTFGDGFQQPQHPQLPPRVPQRDLSGSRNQLANGRFNSFSRPNDDYDCGASH